MRVRQITAAGAELDLVLGKGLRVAVESRAGEIAISIHGMNRVYSRHGRDPTTLAGAAAGAGAQGHAGGCRHRGAADGQGTLANRLTAGRRYLTLDDLGVLVQAGELMGLEVKTTRRAGVEDLRGARAFQAAFARTGEKPRVAVLHMGSEARFLGDEAWSLGLGTWLPR